MCPKSELKRMNPLIVRSGDLSVNAQRPVFLQRSEKESIT